MNAKQQEKIVRLEEKQKSMSSEIERLEFMIMDIKSRRGSEDGYDNPEDFMTMQKTLEEFEAMNQSFFSKQCHAFGKLNQTLQKLRHQQGGKETLNERMVELEMMMNMFRDENVELKRKIDGMGKTLEEKEAELKDLESLNQTLMVVERKSNNEIQEAREELVCGLKELPGCVSIGIKRMGELDPAPFTAAVRKRNCTRLGHRNTGLELGACWNERVESGKLCSLWEKQLRDPSWHPYRMVRVGDQYEEIIDDEDPKLKGLKADFGEEAYKAVTTSLLEMNEYNPSGRYPVSQIWNFLEGRKASLKEGYGFVFEKLKNVGKSSVVSSSSIAIVVANPSSSAPRPNIAATNPSSYAPHPNTATTNPSSSAPCPNIAATNPSSSTPSYLDPCEIPAEEFHDFMADKSYGKFRSGQIWALYCYLDDLPRYYVRITRVKTNPDFKVHIQYLDSYFSPNHKIRWADKNMPICCGTFNVGGETEVYKNVHPFSQWYLQN